MGVLAAVEPGRGERRDRRAPKLPPLQVLVYGAGGGAGTLVSLLDLLSRPRTFDELVADGIVYRAGTRPPLFGDSVERRSIEQHLERAVADGAVATDGQQYWRR